MNKSIIGISLITLVVTIIIIIILAGVVILNLVNNNPINAANEAVFKNDLDNFKSELGLYHLNEFSKNPSYNENALQAGKDTVGDIIAGLKNNTKYKDKFIIQNGKLVFLCGTDNENTWAEEVLVEVICHDIDVEISNPSSDIVNSQTDVNYEITFSSEDPIDKLTLENKIELLKENGGSLGTSSITIGLISGDNTSLTRNVSVTVNTDGLENGRYKIVVLENAVTNSNNVSNMQKKESTTFEVNNSVLVAPEISAIPTSWTNQNVSVTILYYQGATDRKYSIDGGVNWLDYSSAISISDNLTIIAKVTNLEGTESMSSSLTIDNIDRVSPEIILSGGAITLSSIEVSVSSSSDIGGSGLDTSSYQYSKDDGITWTETTNDTTYIFDELTTGTYTCKVKVKDIAGNESISNSLELTTEGIGEISIIPSTTEWTNQNILVTINYPTQVAIKEYSTNNGTTWNNYIDTITITSNTMILARGKDAGGNQIAQSNLEITKIDKIVPSIALSTGATTSSSQLIFIKLASDEGGSGINESSYQYSKDNGTTWIETTSETRYTFVGLATGNYMFKAKVKDNAGNEAISGSVSRDIAGPGNITIGVSTSSWTNSNVIVTINYPSQLTTRQYSLDGGSTWNNYTGTITMTANGTIIARGSDSAGNSSPTSSIQVTNIDKIVPQNAIITASSNNDTVTGSVTISDSQSQISLTTSRYIVTTISTMYSTTDPIWNTATTFTSNPQNISAGNLADGNYYIQVLSIDRAGNRRVNISNKITISTIIEPGYISSEGVNGPVLKNGMTPIKWNGNSWVDTTPNDANWYNYANREWANAKTADGSMWVWIPRYEYKIPVTHSSTPQTILINFVQNEKVVPTSGYIMHPAFTFGNTQLMGIWVAKFEATAREGLSDSGNNVTTKHVKIIPGVNPWNYIYVGNMFTVSRNMETDSAYGWGINGSKIDTHLMKNIEWGAVAYLSHSNYGKNSEVLINSTSYTGGGEGNSYVSNGAQSTTGNIYGVYDMSGGLFEDTAAYVQNSGAQNNIYMTALANAENKYKDLYTISNENTSNANYLLASQIKGDAIYETSVLSGTSITSWYNDYGYMPNSEFYLFNRGGNSGFGNSAGLFSFYMSSAGVASNRDGFRPVLAVDSQL